jgi:hypothetical protein
MTRRVTLAIATLIVAIAATGVFASAARAGGVDTDNGTLDGAIYNATPYTWTLVREVAPATCVSQFNSCFVGPPAASISPGSAPVWTIAPNVADFPVIGNLFSTQFGYDVYFVYKTQPASGPPEYLTITLSQCYCNGTYNGFKQSQPAHVAWITSSPPPSGYDPGNNPNAPPGPSVPNAEVQASVATPQAFDTTLSLTGDHTIDASTQQGQQLGDLLNQLCSGSSGTTCSFTQDGPTQYGPGTLTNTGLGFTCTLPPPGGGGGGGGTGGRSGGPPSSADPPKVDTGFVSVGYTATESASLTVGGSITVGTKFNLFNTIAGKIAVTVQAQHEWTESKTLTRTAYVYIPDYSIGKIFVAPTVGKVTGTLVATTGSSKYTITNFSETRSGVSNDGDTTKVADPTNPTNPNGLPQFEVLTDTYPMTPAQRTQLCPSGQPAGLGSAASRPAPTRLVPGRGVAKVQLGESQGRVSRTLGRPRTRLFWPWPCRGLQRGCNAMPAAGGTWTYRGLSVRFAADRHVAGLIYRGHRLTARGLGVGSALTLVRATYPGASCTPLVEGKRYAKRVYCTLAGHLGSAPAETVFRFQRPQGHSFECDQVAIYLVDPNAKGAT